MAALQQGGPGLLATLIIVSSLFQFLLAGRLAILRRILTPTVAGTVIMLIAVNVMPFLFDFMDNVPEGSGPLAAPVTVMATLVVTLGVMLKFSGPARLWGPLIGIVAGVIAASFFGVLDGGPVREAMWVGVPLAGWPGLGFDFGPAFWAILPAYTFVTLVGAIETIGDAVGIQEGLVARAAGHRLSGRAGGRGRRWLRQPALGTVRHGAQHHLLEQRVGGRDHGDRVAAGGGVYRHHLQRCSPSCRR